MLTSDAYTKTLININWLPCVLFYEKARKRASKKQAVTLKWWRFLYAPAKLRRPCAPFSLVTKNASDTPPSLLYNRFISQPSANSRGAPSVSHGDNEVFHCAK